MNEIWGTSGFFWLSQFTCKLGIHIQAITVLIHSSTECDNFYLNHPSLVYPPFLFSQFLLFSPPQDFTTTPEVQIFGNNKWAECCSPTSLVSHSCFGSGLATVNRFSSFNGPGKDTTKREEKSTFIALDGSHPTFRQMIFVKKSFISQMFIDGWPGKVFSVSLWSYTDG